MKTQFTGELLEQCILEEKKYQFAHFSHADARRLGEMLFENSKSCARTVGVEIRINGDVVYKYMPDSCNRENGKWLRAKGNTVEMMRMSSLHVAAQLALDGEVLEDKKMNSLEYGSLGGGFPVFLRGTGMIGTIAVSGLWHEEDHRLVIRTLEEYLEGEENSALFTE